MQQVGATVAQGESRGLGPVIALVSFATLVASGVMLAGPLAILPLVGALFLAVVITRPEYGIALFLSTFLMTYPQALQGSGFLTINNVLGGVFMILLTYKVYVEDDWWFLGNRELQLLGLIILIYFLSGQLNGPDQHVVELLGVQEYSAANLRTFVTRVLFTVFFVNFIRTPNHVRMIYLLAVTLMVASALVGVQGVISGGGLHGYRASTEASVIASAYNPNRLAMFSILAIAGLWYLRRSVRVPGFSVALVPVMVVMALAVFMTASRSGLVGLVIGVAGILVDERANVRTLFTLALGALFLVVVVLQFVPERSLGRITNLPGLGSGAASEGSHSIERREESVELALILFAKSPFVGVGMGNWEISRFLSDPARSTAAPHSSYLLAMVEGGVFCLVCFLVLLWRTWRSLLFAESWMASAEGPTASLLWIVKAAKVSLVVLVFFSMFADLWQLVILFWLVGLGIVFRRMVEAEQQREEAFAY